MSGVAFQCTCGEAVPIGGAGQKRAQCPNCFLVWRRSEYGDAFVPTDDPRDRDFIDGVTEPIPVAPGQCSCCAGTGLKLGGWMGPTKERPYPDACDCAVGRELDSPRKVQLKVTEMVDRSLEEGTGYWSAKYPKLGTLAGHLEDVQRAVEEETRLPPVLDFHSSTPIPLKSTYEDAHGLDVLEMRMDRYGRDLNPPEFQGSMQEVAEADVVKLVDPRTGAKRVVKHRQQRTPYFECGDDREPFGTCTKRRGHEGAHQDDVKGRGWDP